MCPKRRKKLFYWIVLKARKMPVFKKLYDLIPFEFIISYACNIVTFIIMDFKEKIWNRIIKIIRALELVIFTPYQIFD